MMLILGGKAVEHHNNKDVLKNTAFTVTVALRVFGGSKAKGNAASCRNTELRGN